MRLGHLNNGHSKDSYPAITADLQTINENRVNTSRDTTTNLQKRSEFVDPALNIERSLGRKLSNHASKKFGLIKTDISHAHMQEVLDKMKMQSSFYLDRHL